jgi:hypothetical protein
MLKDMLVQIPSERPIRPVVDGAISLATNYPARLDAVRSALKARISDLRWMAQLPCCSP